MGVIKTQGSEHCAPIYQCSQTGIPVWSGKTEEHFNEALIADIRLFILREAARQGYNDSSQDRIGENSTFFHESFLNGWASQLWDQCYQKGVLEHKNRNICSFHWSIED